METVRIEETVHQPTGKNIIVAVANVNSALAVKASGIMKDLYATLKEVNADQSFIQGEEAGMKAEAAKTLNNKAFYDAGVASGAQQVDAEYNNRASDRAAMARGQSQRSESPSTDSGSSSAGDSQSGSWAGDMEVDDDF